MEGRIVKITFIRPNLYERRSGDAMEPLVFAILKSLTPPDVEVAFHDERLEAIPYDEPTDLVAMTVETYTARRAYQIASGVPRARRAGRDGRLSPHLPSRRSAAASPMPW